MKIQTHRVAWIGCGIVLLAFLLRMHQFDQQPPSNWTADEYAFTWAGMSLLTEGSPESWSWLQSYGEHPEITWQGNPYRIVRPWFDHPPLFSFVPGAAALLGGASEYTDVQLAPIRLPMVLLGTLAVALLFAFSLRLFGLLPAAIASLLYAVHPSTVLLSRLVVSENLLVVLLLTVLLLFLRYRESQSIATAIVLVTLASIAPLFKLTGLSIPCILIILFLFEKKYRESVCICIGTAIGLGLLFLYGALYDFPLFLSVLLEHGDRFTTFSLVDQLIAYSLPLADSLLLFGWLTLLAVSLRQTGQAMLLALPPLVYLFVLLVMGAQSHLYAWYPIPLFPFLFLAAGVALWHVMREPELLSSLFVQIVLWSGTIGFAAQLLTGSPYGTASVRFLFLVVMTVLFAIFLSHTLQPSRTTGILARMAHGVMLGVYVLVSVMQVVGADL